MATSKKADETDQLFAGLSEDGPDTVDPFAGMDELLDLVEEDDSEGWVPTEKGEGLAGKIVRIGQTRSDFARPGEDPMVPTWTIDGVTISVAGEKTAGKFRVIGYSTVLRREMQEAAEDQRAVIGSRAALKYFGEKIVKNGPYAGKAFKHTGMAVQPPA